MKKPVYDILIIGCGPAGISTATIIGEKNKKLKIALIDAGHDYKKRHCFIDHRKECMNCNPCNVISGYGGSLHYGDSVKLSKFPAGKHLVDLLGKKMANEYMNIALNKFIKKEATKKFVFPEKNFLPFKDIKCYPVATLNADDVKLFLKKTYIKLKKTENLDLFLNTNVVSIKPLEEGSNFKIFCLNNKMNINLLANKIIFAGGRYGLRWCGKTAHDLGINHSQSNPFLGLRFEGPKELFKEAGKIHPDLKLSFHKNGKYKIKTFCFCGGIGGGRIKTINYGAYTLLDGHVVVEKNNNRCPGNFALIIKNESLNKEDYKIKNRINRIIFSYKNLPNRGRPVFQLYKDFKNKSKTMLSIDKIKASLGFLPSINYIKNSDLSVFFNKEEHDFLCKTFEYIFQRLYSLSSLPKNVYTRKKILDNMLVMGLELENSWDKLYLKPSMETSVKNIYVAGDATGLAQGVLQAMVSGIAAANGCLK